MLFLLSILFNSLNQHANQIDLKDGIIISTADNENCTYDVYYSVRLISTTILCLFQCSFLSINSQSQKGGAIYVNLKTLYSQSHIISKCNISSCQGLYGGGIYFESTETSNIQITESIFSNNRAKNFGGSVYFKQTTFSITNCSFNTNKILEATSNIYGGSNYFCYSEGTIESTNFSNNLLSNSLSSENNIYAYGGSIHIINSSVEIQNCIFINNTSYAIPSSPFSYSNGGAICLTRSFCNLTFCEFYNNTCTGDASKASTLGYGGGFYANISSNVIINSCQFDHNGLRNVGPSLRYISVMGGGSVYLKNSISIIENCKFTNNFCFAHAFSNINNLQSAGAAVTVQYTNLSIKHSFFYNNSVYTFCKYEQFPEVFGGAICYTTNTDGYETYFDCSNCEFINHTIYVNTLSSHAYGGSIYANGYSNIINCKFINSSAIVDQNKYNSEGGAIYILNGSINNCVFINNVAEYGGDIYYNQGYYNYFWDDYFPNCQLNISNCIFEETISRDFYMKSIFYYEISYNVSYPFCFTNNKIFVSESNTSKILLFNGTIQEFYYPYQFKMLFQNNCIYPYDESFFIFEKLIINDVSGLYNVTFSDAFEKACFLPTNQFSFSDQFSKSEIFTKSDVFTETSGFSASNKFSFSDQFSPSELFTSSQQFTASNWFTKTSFFSNSVIFSISSPFSDSSSCSENYLFSSIHSLTLSRKFTKSEIFSISDHFSDSSSFSFYESFSSNQIFTLSKEVSKVINSFSEQLESYNELLLNWHIFNKKIKFSI